MGSLDFIAATKDLTNQGGPFVWLIFLNGALLWMLVAERYWFFRNRLPGMADELHAKWVARRDHRSWSSRQIRRAMISSLNGAMTAGLPVLNMLVPLAPLLGLIGTVSGMLEVFDSMALRGSADARTMASGVSTAMICTMTGLAVSITGLYPQYYFRNRARRETELLADRFTF
ncbi:MAG TPA: MotA/TolQ/ExbB proton channel family protein [Myxococcota bacterium]|nr:MotA/TolQ/ExbB proton channel family protein [Myxococcota bacterium]